MKIEIDNLQGVKNYAAERTLTTSYIYRLIREGKIKPITIDGVSFIDITKYPTIHGKK